MSDPFTEIREAEAWLEFFRESANPRRAEERWEYLDQAAVHVELLLAALARLEREAAEREATAVAPTEAETAAFELGLKQGAAERETALAEWKEPWRIIAVNDVPFDGDLHLTPATVVARLKELQARVREVEAERDRADGARDKWKKNYLAAEDEADALQTVNAELRATVAQQAETLQEIAGMCDVGTPNGNTYIEARRLARARLASPEAPAADTMITSSHHRAEAPAAEPRGQCDARYGLARCERFAGHEGQHEGFPDAVWGLPEPAALPAVDAPPEPTT